MKDATHIDTITKIHYITGSNAREYAQIWNPITKEWQTSTRLNIEIKTSDRFLELDNEPS